MMIADTGSTREALTKDDIQKFKIRIPQVSEQNSIVAILNSYTRLIDLNNDRCKNLESECSELFKEWFVRMRFPGSKAVTFEKGIPIDWEVKSIGCVVNYHIGGGWGSDVQDKIFSTSGYVIRGTDLPNIKSGIANLEVLRYHKLSNIKSRELQEGDIIFETAGGSEGQPLGRTCYITQEILDAYGDKAIAASFCKQIRTTSIPSMYLYYFLNYLWDTGMIETYQVQSTGISNFQFEPFLKFQQIILPDKNLMQKFHDIVLPMHKQIATLGTQNTKLREIRDRLLPRLISGKLQVKSGEIESLVPSSTKEANLA
jgi:type I restriction enzyme S subunit